MKTNNDDDARKPLTFAEAAEKHRDTSSPSERRDKIIRRARELLAGPAWTNTDEGLCSQMSDLMRPGQEWSEFVREVRAALKGGALLKGDAVGGAGEVPFEATAPGKAALSLTAPAPAMTEARRQAIVNGLSASGLTGRERRELKARGIDVNLALDSTGFSGQYKSPLDETPAMRQAQDVAEMPEERRQAVVKEALKNAGYQTDGFSPAEAEEARDMIARATSVMRGRSLPRLDAAVRDAAAVAQGTKAKGNILDRLRALVEEAEWTKLGWSA